MVNGAGDDVARREFSARIEARHETLAAARQFQKRAFAAQRFRNQEGPRILVKQAGRVELHEFHVGNPAAGAPGHGDAVTRGTVRVARIQIDHVGAAGGEHHGFRRVRVHAAGVAIEQIGAEGLVGGFVDDQVHGDRVFEHPDLRVRTGQRGEGGFHGPSGGVGGVHHAAVAVAAFAGQVQRRVRGVVLVVREHNALFHQPTDAGRSALHGECHRLLVAQAGPRGEGVADVGGQRIIFVQNRRDAALCPQRAAAQQFGFRHHGHGMALLRQPQGAGQAGRAAADDENVR